MFTVPVRRVCFVHKVLDLGDDREGFSDKGGQPPLGRDLTILIPENSLRGRAKNSDMIGECGGNISKKIRSLWQHVLPIPVPQPVLVGGRAMYDFLQAKDIGAGTL
jgi:hypothetical protein